MPSKKKPFIDKKRSVTFEIVHRSQQDPLAADENAPQHVLIEKKSRKVYNFDDKASVSSLTSTKRLEEQQKYGIYFDDDYNYLQHLRDTRELPDMAPTVTRYYPIPDASDDETESVAESVAPTIVLPSSVFASQHQEAVGLLNKAAPHSGPRPDWDPDIVAALDDDFDFDDEDNQLDDDFVIKAMEPGDDGDAEEYGQEHDFDSDGEEPDMNGEFGFEGEETKSKFTNYSLSSSVITRSTGLQNLDDHFDRFYDKYDDDAIGPLDEDDIEGHLELQCEQLRSLALKYDQERQLTMADAVHQPEELKAIKSKILERATLQEDGDDETVKMTFYADKKEDRLDCESILSSYSTVSNRPKLITVEKRANIPSTIPEKVILKGGIPIKRNEGLTKQGLKMLEGADCVSQGPQSIRSRYSIVSTPRPPDETPEERRARKSQIKEYRRERRLEKKLNTLAFKAEAKTQEKALINQRNQQRTVKLF